VKGLELGDQVVIDGVDRLRDGAKIRRPGSGAPAVAGRPVRGPPAGRQGAGRAGGAQPERQRRGPPGDREGQGGNGERRGGGAGRRKPTNRSGRGMNPSRIFIERPVGTSLFMVAIMLVGMIAYRFLPLSALPEVDYPTIRVLTLYPGAGPR
jgi:hypothetical protein